MNFSNYNVELIVHHGTYDVASDKITEAKQFHSEDRDDHWLGQGIYFFREDFEQAKIWGQSALKKQVRKGNIKEGKVAVISAILNVERKNFWNLDSRGDLIKFQEHISKELLELRRQRIELDISPEEADKLRCYFCDLINNEIYLIQRTFPGKSYLDKDETLVNMGLRQHGVQVCVRNQEIIDLGSIQSIKLDDTSIFSRRKGNRYSRSIVFEE